MKNLNILVRSILMIGLSLSIMACDKKKDSKPNFADRYNRQQYVDPNGNIVTGGNPLASQQCPNCGYITSNMPDMSGVLKQFLLMDPNSQDLGVTSGQSNGQTGVLFRGNVDSTGRSGYVEIIIWDEIANYSQQAYVVRLDVDPTANNYVDQQGATITFADDAGTVTFNGQWYLDGTYQGQVSFNNFGQGQGTLGNFVTGAYSFVR